MHSDPVKLAGEGGLLVSQDSWQLPPIRALRWALVVVAAAVVGLLGAACWINYARPVAIDFVSFWAAGSLAITGDGAAAYDIGAHRAIEQRAVEFEGFIPFPYPPPFLLLVAPLSLLPYAAAFPLWLLATATIYVAAARPFAAPRLALSYPGVLSTGIIGQTGFLTSGIFFAGIGLLKSRPFLAGSILGLLIIKPQLALMLPVALIANRHWTAIVGAVASSAALLLTGLLVFGADAYLGFARMAPRYAAFMGASRWPWEELASPYAFARYFGLPPAPAIALHLLIAAGAAAIVWRSWRKGGEERVPILAAATLLAPPYLFSYDALLLVLPLAWLLRERQYAVAAMVWALSLLPVAAIFGLFSGPNTLPVAALLSLAILYRGRGSSFSVRPVATSSVAR